ncbi:A/G-specific adenine glycosylase [Sphingomonas gilva]|uniref:Adenine DNA glycosylase n=1 Tax=Sphingomonas gilva TaxID=2305907 RepID=A0A396RQY1_9SPHN|nr:A/G-specific adenine glycosylase [Sphingomonas gilva]RHW18386.1 A/G-specific adenine glycosylase [Sphingomonas gilva]
MPVENQIANKLLAHYDAQARSLPWRSPPGAPPADPYRVWLSEIMLQQTTVAAAAPYFERFTKRWPTVEALAAAEDADLMAAWAGLGYYARARNLLATARAVAGKGFPDTEAGLRELPGIGGYTAAAIAAIAFGHRAVVVDANVERVVARLFAIADPLPGAKPAIRAAADSITPDGRAGDFAQAMMDLGATICTVRAPACLACPIHEHCAGYVSGDPTAFPVKAAKKARPVRHGTIFWLERGKDVLLVRRPDKGLLGGMRALPTGSWGDSPPGLAGAPCDVGWHAVEPVVTHVFTHFELRLALVAGTSEKHCKMQPGWEWWPKDRIGQAGLPTVFAKAASIFGRDG